MGDMKEMVHVMHCKIGQIEEAAPCGVKEAARLAVGLRLPPLESWSNNREEQDVRPGRRDRQRDTMMGRSKRGRHNNTLAYRDSK